MSEAKLGTTVEAPIAVKALNEKVAGWIHKLGYVHVEGQVTQYQRRGSNRICFMTLRDPNANSSILVKMNESALPDDLADGAHVVIEGKPQFWTNRGTFQMHARTIHLLGEGDLLAKVDKTRRELKGEGLFDADRKKPIPFLPNKIGLITGANSHAEQDVLTVAGNRWPGIRFEVKHARVQGKFTVGEVMTSLKVLDEDPEVDVIVIARGGGSVEDLLPFSSEEMVRAVSRCSTPVVSAIGHQPDNPILDDVADVRAATPTDAAKTVVPNMHAERGAVSSLADQVDRAVSRILEGDRTAIQRDFALCARYPGHLVEREQAFLDSTTAAIDNSVRNLVARERARIEYLAGQLEALNPTAVLDRGYAVVKTDNGGVLDTAAALQVSLQLNQSFSIQFADNTVRIQIEEGRITIQ